MKQKLLGRSVLGGGRIIFLGPKSGSGRTWAPCASGAMVNHFQATFNVQDV